MKGLYELSRSEEEQIGFRLAKKMGLKKLYCVDSWGKDYEYIKQVLAGNDSIAKADFFNFFYHNPDTIYSGSKNNKLFKKEGILVELKRVNSEENYKSSLGFYLTGVFKYETKEHKQFGPDFVTSWWFNRNLRIFRNIQRINANPEDRILVIYGHGHLNLLNLFFESSPEYKLLDVNELLN